MTIKAIEMITNGHGVTNSATVLCGGDIAAWEAKNLEPSTRYATLLIPIPDGYRLVTDDERKTKKKPSEVRMLSQDSISTGLLKAPRVEKVGLRTCWAPQALYIIPIDHVWETVLDVTVTVNGEQVPPSSVSKETWDNLRTVK